jgi:hypothetical protein
MVDDTPHCVEVVPTVINQLILETSVCSIRTLSMTIFWIRAL